MRPSTTTMQQAIGLFICIFAIIRLISHPSAQNRPVDYILMAVMIASGIFLILAKKPEASDKK